MMENGGHGHHGVHVLLLVVKESKQKHDYVTILCLVLGERIVREIRPYLKTEPCNNEKIKVVIQTLAQVRNLAEFFVIYHYN